MGMFVDTKKFGDFATMNKNLFKQKLYLVTSGYRQSRPKKCYCHSQLEPFLTNYYVTNRKLYTS